jgi:hypothetical protein
MIIDLNETCNSFLSMDSLPEEVSNQINEFLSKIRYANNKMVSSTEGLEWPN